MNCQHLIYHNNVESYIAKFFNDVDGVSAWQILFNNGHLFIKTF